MGIGSVMVDKAYAVSRIKDPVSREGGHSWTDVQGEEFRCFLDFRPKTEQRGDGGARRNVTGIQLYTGKRDKKGQLMVFSDRQKIVVTSRKFGVQTYEVTGEPQPIAKKSSTLGWILSLSSTDRIAAG